MTILRALALLVCLAGCAVQIPTQSTALPGAAPAAPAAPTVPDTALGATATAAATTPTPSLLPEVPLDPHLAAADAALASDEAADAAIVVANAAGVPVALAEDEDAESDPPDAETEQDNQLLTAAVQPLPDDAGAPVQPEAVVFDFPVVENQKVLYFVNYYSGPGREVFTRWLERSTRHLPMMQEVFAEYGLPRDLAYLAMVESGFNPKAYSWARASGPWQFMSGTGRIFGLHDDWWHDDRRDFDKATRAAAHHLKDLHDFFGDWYLAVAAYNAGIGKVARAVNKYETRDFWELSKGKYLREETKNYVPKLLAVLLLAKQPEKYGFVNLQYQQPVATETVIVPTSTDLEVVARLCEVDSESIQNLNPELKRWCTPPGVKDYALRIPVGTSAKFAAAYAALPVSERAHYQQHKIKSGDTLQGLAKRYQIRVADIVALNNIRNPKALRIGGNLILPLKPGYTRLPPGAVADDYVRTRRPTYTVRAGDTLWKIAQRNDVSERQLRVWNNLGWSNTIRPGQVLLVSATASKPAPARKSAKGTKSAKASSGSKTKKIVYTVKSGDTLAKIARRYDVTTSRICDWNNLASPDALRPGQSLTLLVADAGRG